MESLNSSLASEEHDSSDGGSSMFEETEDLTSSAISHHAGHAGELYLSYQIPPVANNVVSEPDPRKIGKEGLAHRLGWKCTLRNVRNFINC